MMNSVRLLLIIVILLSLLPLSVHAAAPADIAVVVSKGVQVDNLTLNDLRKLLLGHRQFWPSNMRVTLLIRQPMTHERDVVLDIVQMSEAQFSRYWIGKVFSAESATSPQTVTTNAMAAGLINAIPGSLAFIEYTQVPKDLKVLRIDGLQPGEKGYPLK